MGFFSWKCALTGKSVPAYPYAGRPVKGSTVVMVLPDDSVVRGVYDGYGHISGHDVYDLIAPFFFKRPHARGGDFFGNTKYITSPEGEKFEVDQFNWSEPIEAFGGKSLNALAKEGYEITSDFYLLHAAKMIKIVREDAYKGQRYEELPGSEDCPDQGYFYSEDEEEAED
jgi:hypothetical protein